MTQHVVYTFSGHDTSAPYTITNYGAGGSSYDGTGLQSAYPYSAWDGWASRNGHGTWGPFSASSYRFKQPNGSYNNMADVHSWQIGFYMNAYNTTYNFNHLWDKAYGAYVVKLHGDNAGGSYNWWIEVTREQTGAPGYPVYWTARTTKIETGHNYYVQISANMPSNHNPQSAASGNVHIHIAKDDGSPVHQTIEFGCDGYVGTSWFNDTNDPNNVMIGNSPENGYQHNAYYWIVREDNTAINWDTAGDWATDKALWSTSVDTQISISASSLTPPLDSTYTISGTLQTVGGTKLANKSLDVYWSVDDGDTWNVEFDFVTTDVNGHYSYNQTAIADEWEFVVYAGESGYNNCLSSVVKVYGSAGNAAWTESTIPHTTFAPLAPTVSVGVGYAQTTIPGTALGVLAPFVTVNESPNVDVSTIPGAHLGVIAPTAVGEIVATPATIEGGGFEAIPVYGDILGFFEYAFPTTIENEIAECDDATAHHIGQLSTEAHPTVVNTEIIAQYISANISLLVTPAVVDSTSIAVVAPDHIYVENPVVLEVDAIITEALGQLCRHDLQVPDNIPVNAEIAETVTLTGIITESETLELEVSVE